MSTASARRSPPATLCPPANQHSPPEQTSGPRGRAGLFPLTFLPPFSPTLRQLQFGPRRRSSLPSAKTRSLRAGRASNPQGPAASSPCQRSRRRFCRRRPWTASTPKSQIPTLTGPRRRQPSSGGFGPATPAERPVSRSVSLGCQGPAAAARRAVPSPVPCGRSATCVFSACRRFDVPQPAIAAGSVSRCG